VDITALEALRQRRKATVQTAGGRLTLTVLAVKAVTAALQDHPRFNASLDMAAEQISLKKYYHIGVAVDTPDGLIVPVLRDTDRKSIVQLAVELTDLVERTRQRKVRLEELQGGSFTITNIGSLGGGHFSAIINAPQVDIFGMGAARLRPAVVVSDSGSPEIVPRLMLPLVLAVDHRVLDGADAMRFMRQVGGLLSDPEQLLMEMP
jgi:pyruvate dehydrogenase E2 component (dihydrolipoamide acetyltransferase)